MVVEVGIEVEYLYGVVVFFCIVGDVDYLVVFEFVDLFDGGVDWFGGGGYYQGFVGLGFVDVEQVYVGGEVGYVEQVQGVGWMFW